MPRTKKIPAAPPAPNMREALTPTEQWYLFCLEILSKHLERPPSLPELAAYCERTVTPTYLALVSCERKGYATRGRVDRKWRLAP